MNYHFIDLEPKETFEYHGSTVIERTRLFAGKTISRDWILFDSVEEASDYFNDYCYGQEAL